MSFKFKVNDLVRSPQEGIGKVVSTYDDGSSYPVTVKFSSGQIETYLRSGRYHRGWSSNNFDIQLLK